MCFPDAHGATVRISSGALERTLRKQLFREPGGRFYLRGNSGSACYVYAENPQVSFHEGRVFVHMDTHARVGSAIFGSCLGFGLNLPTDVSLVPEADGDSVGFRDPRLENLGGSEDLKRLLVPFLSRKLPQEMKLNAADLLRKALVTSQQTTGYDLRLASVTMRSLQIVQDALVLEMDGVLDVY